MILIKIKTIHYDSYNKTN